MTLTLWRYEDIGGNVSYVNGGKSNALAGGLIYAGWRHDSIYRHRADETVEF